MQDGDKIKITPISREQNRLPGRVSTAGQVRVQRRHATVADLIRSYKDLLPEPSTTHAEIIRLAEPDYTPIVLAFNLEDALAGKDQDPVLKPFDTIRVFESYDFEYPPIITISGEVRDPEITHLTGRRVPRDAIYLAGGTTRDALLDDAQIYRKTNDGKHQVISVNLAKALAGDDL